VREEEDIHQLAVSDKGGDGDVAGGTRRLFPRVSLRTTCAAGERSVRPLRGEAAPASNRSSPLVGDPGPRCRGWVTCVPRRPHVTWARYIADLFLLLFLF
jgi:hypothetical protein